MSEIVFVLGAGASKEAGAPVMANFLDRADKLRISKNTGRFGGDFDAVSKAIGKLQLVHSKAELKLDNIESVLGAFEMGYILEKLPGMTQEEIKTLPASARRLIMQTLEKSIKYPCSEDRGIRPPESYLLFANVVHALNERIRADRCAVITFNYDVALDYALDYSRGSGVEYYLLDPVQSDLPALMKLHGSLNWAQCSQCGAIIPWQLPDYFRKIRRDPEDPHILIEIGSKLPDSGLKHCSTQVLPEPLIVPPTWNKTQYRKELLNVWRHAAMHLSEAQYLVIIGYSFPKNDEFFKYLYALGSVSEVRFKKILIINPDDEVPKRYLDIIGAGAREQFEFLQMGFSQGISWVAKMFGVLQDG